MRKMMRKRMARALSVLLAIAAVVAFTPQMSVYAASDGLIEEGDELVAYVTFKVVGGGWNDGTTADRVIRLARDVDEDKALVIEESDIPSVGGKPFYGYEGGEWTQDPFDTYAELHGQVPTDNRTFSHSVTYTYTYERNEIELPTVTFKVKNGKWNDGTTTPKTVKLDSHDYDPPKLSSDDIPAVGKKPNKKYEAGSWDVTPSTKTSLTDDTTYTYTYAKEKPAPEPEPTPTPTKVSGTLLAEMTAKGSSSLSISWLKVNGVDGYDIFFVKCGKTTKTKLVKTIKGNKTFKWTKKNLKKKTAYKAVVKAYVKKNGKKKYVRTSQMVHAYTSGGINKYTNPKSVTVKKTSVTLKKGKTYRIKAKVSKLRKGKKIMASCHAPKLRYVSSNKKVATVSKKGKIKAKSTGSCKVYVITVNGARKTVKVTVK